MDRRKVTIRPITWLPPTIALLLFALASAATGIYYGNTWAISYPTPVSAELLWAHRAALTPGSLWEAWSTGPYDVAFVASVTAWPILLSRRSRWGAVVAAALPLVFLFPINLIGVYMALVELVLRQQWDGETLAEGWPLIELYGLWSAWSLAYLIHSWRRTKAFEPTAAVLGAHS
jgi:hypothetical protein